MHDVVKNNRQGESEGGVELAKKIIITDSLKREYVELAQNQSHALITRTELELATIAMINLPSVKSWKRCGFLLEICPIFDVPELKFH